MTCNNLAWALLLARSDGWLAEADRYSSEAVLLVPELAVMDSTRGCVQVHLGRFLRKVGDEMPRHLEEIRAALTAFVDEPSPDPRREMLRAALGG